MVFKGTATLIVRLSRAILARPFKPIFTHRLPEKLPLTKYPPKFYLFPSIHRSVFVTSNGKNLAPFRMALHDIKRRLFFAGLY